MGTVRFTMLTIIYAIRLSKRSKKLLTTSDNPKSPYYQWLMPRSLEIYEFATPVERKQKQRLFRSVPRYLSCFDFHIDDRPFYNPILWARGCSY